ncbi:Signal recognition particle receptor subunit beta, a GTPase [Actinacidiphila cocklensis]|uniref:Signal recognition particle receptor subunit beta, a GTPase n=2 Tax=Actinacidiphila cocklensis TaxID=887465 RepID=A0A9W4GPV1_9ACTN|nr:Signal recognition particle receptor subunit beta, a GTPase [Actinacidiphila cocklensis]
MDSVPSPEPATAPVAAPRPEPRTESRPEPGPGTVRYLPSTGQTLMKLVVTGPFGVGKTTLIRTLSEIPTLHTEEVMTTSSAGLDDLRGLPEKATTTVAVDFGRLTVPGDLVLYLFGTPGQERFFPLWQDIARGALGALVMADTRRLADSFPVMDMVEEQGLPYAVAVNRFPGAPAHSDEVLRRHLDLAPETPLVQCDARNRRDSIGTLIALGEYVLSRLTQDAP